LDSIIPQHTADEIFTTSVLAGVKVAAKLAQRVIGVVDDGEIGPKTIAALNAYNASLMNKNYDDEEIKYYKSLISANPKFAIYEKGWINRAVAV
jgi:lysozyme family protein